jgi:hypothetical protein
VPAAVFKNVSLCLAPRFKGFVHRFKNYVGENPTLQLVEPVPGMPARSPPRLRLLLCERSYIVAFNPALTHVLLVPARLLN